MRHRQRKQGFGTMGFTAQLGMLLLLSATLNSVQACTEYQFTCGNGDCISNSRVCDGSPDCYDQNDESNCGLCSPGQFPCDNGQCITISDICDGVYQCDDMSDENSCPCKDYQFTCDNGDCVSEDSVCDHLQDCNDRSDESNCSNTCYAMGDIKNQLSIWQRFSGSYSCYLNNDCTKVDCEEGGLTLILQPCYSPPAIQLGIWRYGDIVDMFHTFTKTEAVSVTVQDSTIIVKITLDHLEDAIGLQVDVFKDGCNSTVVQFTKIPLNMGQCSGGETGKADTCNAMQSIANDLIFLHSASWATYRACTKDSDCNEIACTGVELDSSLKLTTLPCYSPPAIQLEIVYKGATYLDHTFAETEEVFVTIEGVISIIRVILYHPDKSSIFLQVSKPTFYGLDTIIPITMIPLDTSGCPGSDTALEKDGDGTGGDDRNGVVVGLAVGVPVLVLCCVGVGILVVVVVVQYRRKRDVFEFKLHTSTDDSDKTED